MKYFALVLTLIPIVYFLYGTLARGSWRLVDSFVVGVILYQLGVCVLLFKVGVDTDSLVIFQTSTLCLFLSVLSSRWFSFSSKISLENLYIPYYQKIYFQLFIIGYFGILLLNVIIFSVIFLKFKDLLLSGEPGALLDVRKQIAGGERGYMWPGLIKQIRDIITPAIIAYCILFLNGRNRYYFLIPLVIACLMSVFIGGQRFPLIVLILVIVTSVLISDSKAIKELFTLNNIIKVLLVLAIILLLNSFLGRGSFTVMGFVAMVGGLFERMTLTVPLENYKVASYFKENSFSMFSIWTSELASLIPGNRFTLSNDLHAYMGGSNQGNSTLGGAMSGYYNAGYIGVVIYVVAFVGLLSLMDYLIKKSNSRLLLSLRVVLFFLIPMWYSFFHVFLSGSLVFILFILMVVFFKIVLPRNAYK